MVTNSGLIKGQTDSAIVVLGAASGFTVTINNEAHGTIEGGGDTAAAIQTGADNDTVNNAGEVTADASGKAIDLGDGEDTLNITGGTIEGDISGGSGTNICTIALGKKHFDYTGSISDFDSIEIQSGVVTFFGASTYTGTTTVSGGTLIVANTTGSATGSGPVNVTGGTLGGTGSNRRRRQHRRRQRILFARSGIARATGGDTHHRKHPYISDRRDLSL